MEISPMTGKTADPSLLINVPRLVAACDTGRPHPSVPAQRVVFGTSGHRGFTPGNAFNEAHKIYAESFKDQGPLDAIVNEAQEIVNHVLESIDSSYQQREARE
jgi:hypothetical protein